MPRFSRIHQYILQHKGMATSLLLHIGLIILLLLNFSSCHRQVPQQVIIAVDLLPIAQITNIENKQNKSKITEKEKPITKPQPVEKPVEEVEKKPEPKPEEKPEPKPEPKPELTPEIVKKESVKEKPIEKLAKPKPPVKAAAKVEDKKKKKKQKPKVDEYEQMLKDLTKATDEASEVEEKVEKVSRGPHNPNASLSLSLKDSIKRQIEQCWSPPAGNKDAGMLRVEIDINFKPDGSVASAKVINTSRYASDEMFRVAADAAVRAVYKCSPLQGLPVEQYSAWENIEFNFDPSEMIY